MSKRRRQPARRDPPPQTHSSGGIHTGVLEVSSELTAALDRVSLDHWEPKHRDQGEAELRHAISLASDSPARRQMLFEMVLETVYMRANIALDYMKSLPLLLTSDSLLAVRPMARVALEALARLDWHCEPDISPEERVLRVFTDLNKTFGKVEGRWLGNRTLHDESEERRANVTFIGQQSELLRSTANEEIRRMGEVVERNHGTRRRNESKKFKDPTLAVDDALAQTVQGPAGASWYSILSDSVHADSNVLALRLMQRDESRGTLPFSHTPTLADHLMPVASAVTLMFQTLLRMDSYWRVSFPHDDINSICGLLYRHVTERGDDAVWCS